MCCRLVKVNCYLATRPEVEGFRDQGFVLPEVESLRVRVCGFLKSSSLRLRVCVFLKKVYPQGRSQTLVYQS